MAKKEAPPALTSSPALLEVLGQIAGRPTGGYEERPSCQGIRVTSTHSYVTDGHLGVRIDHRGQAPSAEHFEAGMGAPPATAACVTLKASLLRRVADILEAAKVEDVTLTISRSRTKPLWVAAKGVRISVMPTTLPPQDWDDPKEGQ